MFHSLQAHGQQHARPPCPSPPPKVGSSSCPLHWWCHPAISSSNALFSFLPTIFPIIRDFSNESVLHIRWPKYWNFSFIISHSNEYSGLISIKIDCFDILEVQGTQESSPTRQFKSIEFLRSAFFVVQLSHSYVTTGNMIALTLVQFSRSVVSDICNPKDFSTLGLPVLHYLL